MDSSLLKNIIMKNCGISKKLGTRIINGKDAEEGAYPWAVAILKLGDSWCGGAVLNEWWIITASHCFMEFVIISIAFICFKLFQ